MDSDEIQGQNSGTSNVSSLILIPLRYMDLDDGSKEESDPTAIDLPSGTIIECNKNLLKYSLGFISFSSFTGNVDICTTSKEEAVPTKENVNGSTTSKELVSDEDITQNHLIEGSPDERNQVPAVSIVNDNESQPLVAVHSTLTAAPTSAKTEEKNPNHCPSEMEVDFECSLDDSIVVVRRQ